MAGIIQTALTAPKAPTPVVPQVTPADTRIADQTYNPSATKQANPVAQATTSTYTPTKLADPTKWTSTQEQTVAGQIKNLTDPNSPLIQQARSRALQQANSRGLLNSSMAMTGADSAAYDTAMPIAQADAASAGRIAGYNADTANQFKTNEYNTQTQAGLTNAAAQNQGSQFNTSQTNTARTQQVQQGFDLARMDRQAALTIGQMSAQQQNDIAKMATAQGYDLARMTAQQVNDLAKINATFTNEQKMMLEKFGYDKDLVNIQAENNIRIGEMEAQYKGLTQASASAASIMNSVGINVDRIMQNEKLDAAAKQKAIDTYSSNANKSLMIIGALSGDVDFSDFLAEVLGPEPTDA